MTYDVLAIFILFPLIFWAADMILVYQKRNMKKHMALLLFGVGFIVLCALAAYVNGIHPMRGVIWGSVAYAPVYVVAWLGISMGLRHLETQEHESDIA